jgi:hypothetical protein
MPVFAEHLRKEYDMFKQQNPQQIADVSAAPEILDRAIAFVSNFPVQISNHDGFSVGSSAMCGPTIRTSRNT